MRVVDLVAPVLGDAMDLGVGDEDTLEPHRAGQVGRLVEHVAAPDEVLGAGRVEDRPRVDLRGHGERDAALGREDHVDPGRPRLLGEADDGVLDVLALAHHEVGQLVDDDDDVRQAVLGIRPGLVVGLDVPGASTGKPAIAALHLVDCPFQRGLRAVRLCDDRHEEVRQAVVARELDPLEVHQDHPDVVGGRLAEQARDDGVHHHALAGAGRAGDEEVGHLREVDGLGLAGHVAPEGERQLRLGGGERDLLEDAAEGNDVEVLVRDLDADGALARDRGLDPERAGGQRHRQVVGEGLDARHADVDGRLDLVLGDDGPRVAGDDHGADPEARQLLGDDLLVPSVRGGAAAGLGRVGDVLEQGQVSSRTRIGRGGSARSVADDPSDSPLRPRAKVAEVGIVLGTAAGIRLSLVASATLPQSPV